MEDYEEALMNEKITEEDLYQENDQGGCNLRSMIVAPSKKSSVLAKDPAPATKNIAIPPRNMVTIIKQ